MPQLATLSARPASEAPDLLITPGCRAAPWAVLHTPQKLFPTGLAATIAVPISTSGNSALLIAAGYMIVNCTSSWTQNDAAQTWGASSVRNCQVGHEPVRVVQLVGGSLGATPELRDWP